MRIKCQYFWTVPNTRDQVSQSIYPDVFHTGGFKLFFNFKHDLFFPGA